MMTLLWITVFLVAGGTLLAVHPSLRVISCALWLAAFGVTLAALVVALVTARHPESRADGILGAFVSACVLILLPVLLRLFGFPNAVYKAIAARRRH